MLPIDTFNQKKAIIEGNFYYSASNIYPCFLGSKDYSQFFDSREFNYVKNFKKVVTNEKKCVIENFNIEEHQR